MEVERIDDSARLGKVLVTPMEGDQHGRKLQQVNVDALGDDGLMRVARRRSSCARPADRTPAR